MDDRERTIRRDIQADEICNRLQAAGADGIGGRQLAQAMLLPGGTRGLRRLIAHARIRLHRHEILGLPGEGYFWGPANPDRAARLVKLAARLGRCWFFISTLVKREGTAMALVQQVFDFMEPRQPGSKTHDDLAALVAVEGAGLSDFLDAFIRRVAQTPEGLEILAKVGRAHSRYLMPESVRREMIDHLQAMQRGLESLRPDPARSATAGVGDPLDREAFK